MMDRILGRKAALDSGEGEAVRPVLVYLTTTDAKQAKSLKAWEESRLADDKLGVAVRLFDCYQVDETALPETHVLRSVSRSKAPAFLILTDGQVHDSSGRKPSTSKILSMMKKSLSKLSGVRMDRIVSKGLDLMKERDKLEAAKEEIDKKLKGLKPKDRRRAKYEKELAEVESKENAIKEQEQELFQVAPRSRP